MVVKKRMVTRKRKKREAREWKNEILWQRDREKLNAEMSWSQAAISMPYFGPFSLFGIYE